MAIGTSETNTSPKSAGRTASKETRRHQLIQATVESIARYGISGTTMKTVTSKAGLSLGIVNFHFTSKETLFEETLRFLGEEHRDRWSKSIQDDNLKPEEKLRNIVVASFHPDLCNRKKLAVWFSFYGEAATRAAYRDIMSELDDERWKISAEICKDIIKDGSYEGVNAEEVSDTLEGLYDGFCLNILMYPGVFTPKHAMARILDYLTATFPKHFTRTTA